MRRQSLHRVYRVRGYDSDGQIRLSRMYARRHDADRLARRAAEFYTRVTVEVADIEPFRQIDAYVLHPLLRGSR